MKLLLLALVFFFVLSQVLPKAFVAFGRMIDAPRCAIGMTHYCDRDYDFILYK
jgi:hypothetical protein